MTVKRLLIIVFIPLALLGCASHSGSPLAPEVPLEKKEVSPEPEADLSAETLAAAPKNNVQAPELKTDKRERVLGHFYHGLKNIKDDPDEAIKGFSLALVSAPDFTEARYNLGLVFFRLGDTENAKRELFKSLKKGHKLPQVYDALGTVFLYEGNILGAERAYSYAIALGGSVGAKTNLAGVYRIKGLVEISLKQYRAVERTDPLDPYLNYNLGTLLLQQDDPEGALKRLDRSLVLKDTHPDVLLTLAKARLMNGEIDEALAIYEDMTEASPESAEPHKNMGIVYEIYRQDYEKALYHYNKYLEMKGANAKKVEGWIGIVRAKAGRGK